MDLCGFKVGLDQPLFLIAGPCVIESEQLAMDTAGTLKELCASLGIPFGDLSSGRTVSFPDGHLIKQFTIAEGVAAADGLVSLPKLKTHALTRMTGAVKNQFGCIPGMLKSEFHARMPDIEHFSQMLVDLNRLIRPRLAVMDAVIAMEGNGPRNGDPRPMNILLFPMEGDPLAASAFTGPNLLLRGQDDLFTAGNDVVRAIAEMTDALRGVGATLALSLTTLVAAVGLLADPAVFITATPDEALRAEAADFLRPLLPGITIEVELVPALGREVPQGGESQRGPACAGSPAHRGEGHGVRVRQTAGRASAPPCGRAPRR